MKVLLIVQLEISDHDGYCSGEECVYKSKNIRYIRKIPNENINKSVEDPY